MTVTVTHITIDCANPFTLAGFWRDATGYLEDPEEPNDPDGDEAYLESPNGPHVLLFQRVEEGKTVKNRIHLDVSPTDRTRDEELDRLLDLGASILQDRREDDGTGWVVLADPEGNEFCLERSAAERAEPVQPTTS
jgi:hypothetical protein